jgi:hypothetical protein
LIKEDIRNLNMLSCKEETVISSSTFDITEPRATADPYRKPSEQANALDALPADISRGDNSLYAEQGTMLMNDESKLTAMRSFDGSM